MTGGSTVLETMRQQPGREERPAAAEAAEPRETAGITTRLVVLYAERAGGRQAVEAILARAGFSGCEADLIDENHWVSYAQKIRLFEALAEVLDDREVMLHLGETALGLSVGEGLKLALRALGSPGLVYQNIVRASSKFTRSHQMEMLAIGDDHARLRYADLGEHRFSPLDCEYNIGLLACIPQLFGLPRARITHPVCAGKGGDACVYEISWEGGGNDTRYAIGAGSLAAVLLALTGALDPALLPIAGLAAFGAISQAALRILGRRRARWRRLEAELAEQGRVAEQLSDSLQDLVSELRLDEVLAKVTRNVTTAVPGKEFVLLISGDDGTLACAGASAVPPETILALERWAADTTHWQEPAIIDDTGIVPGLEALARDELAPFRSLAVAPLVYRGDPLGLLAGLAPHTRTFLPRELDLIKAYAIHASIAISNARLYDRQQQLAARDPLTGLLNHREFHEALAFELSECERSGGQVSLALFDLNGFKEVNDSLGHATGDEVLASVAQAMTGVSRPTDRCYRIGGDEFALVLRATAPEAAGRGGGAGRQRRERGRAAGDRRGGRGWKRRRRGRQEEAAAARGCPALREQAVAHQPVAPRGGRGVPTAAGGYWPLVMST